MRLKIHPSDMSFEFSCSHLKRDEDIDMSASIKMIKDHSDWPPSMLKPFKEIIRKGTAYCSHYPDGFCRVLFGKDDEGTPLYNCGTCPCVNDFRALTSNQLMNQMKEHPEWMEVV